MWSYLLSAVCFAHTPNDSSISLYLHYIQIFIFRDKLSHRIILLEWCNMMSHSPGNPTNININLLLSETIVIRLHLSHWKQVYLLHSNFHGELRKTNVFWNRVHKDPSRSSKIVEYGTNWKCTWDFLLVFNRNLAPILPHFRDITTVVCQKPLFSTPNLYSRQNFGVFRLEKICDVVVPTKWRH